MNRWHHHFLLLDGNFCASSGIQFVEVVGGDVCGGVLSSVVCRSYAGEHKLGKVLLLAADEKDREKKKYNTPKPRNHQVAQQTRKPRDPLIAQAHRFQTTVKARKKKKRVQRLFYYSFLSPCFSLCLSKRAAAAEENKKSIKCPSFH